MTLQEFIEKYTGVENTGNTTDNKGQCTGLVMVYVAEVLKLSHIWGHAKDLFNNAPDSEWEKVENAPDKYPKAGDIMCWGGSWGDGFGHTGVVESSSPATDSFVCFEQNYPTGSAPKLINRKSWRGIIGWLSPKKREYLWLYDDIPTNIEDIFNLKSYNWYDKRWTLEDFINNVIQTHDEYRELKENTEKIIETFGQLQIEHKKLITDYEKLIQKYEQLKEEKNIDINQAIEFIIDYIKGRWKK